MRSIARARPVAGSMSICAALNTTGPSPTANRVGRALMKRGSTVAGSNPITLQTGPVIPRSVWYAVQPEGVLLGGELAVEVDDPDRRQRLRRLVEEDVGVGERVLDRLHVRPALEVDDGDVRAVEGLVDPPPAAGDAG